VYRSQSDCRSHAPANGIRTARKGFAGFYGWLEGGGREMLSRLATRREKRKRWERMALDSAALHRSF
jgi:hypothetical protein